MKVSGWKGIEVFAKTREAGAEWGEESKSELDPFNLM